MYVLAAICKGDDVVMMFKFYWCVGCNDEIPRRPS